MCEHCARSTVTDERRQLKEAGPLLPSHSPSCSKAFKGFNVKILLLGFHGLLPLKGIQCHLPWLFSPFPLLPDTTSVPVLLQTPHATSYPCPRACCPLPSSEASGQNLFRCLLGCTCKIHIQSLITSHCLYCYHPDSSHHRVSPGLFGRVSYLPLCFTSARQSLFFTH